MFFSWPPQFGQCSSSAVLAAQVAGTPLPLEQGLLDAIDPGRWQVRATCRS